MYCKNTTAVFSRQPKDKSGYCNPCDDCFRIEKLVKNYKISLFDYFRLMDNQGNSCALCKLPFTSENKPHIDHCHSEGHVRGLLCRNCNFGLGMFKDSPEALINAATYIKSRRYPVKHKKINRASIFRNPGA